MARQHPIRVALAQRKARGLVATQAWLASQVSCTEASICDYVQGRYAPEWPRAKKIGAVLGIDPAALLDWRASLSRRRAA